MPIGKSSITKRVAKQTQPEQETNIAPELVATSAAATKTEANKTTSTTAKKSTGAATKKSTGASTKKPSSTQSNKSSSSAKAPAKRSTPKKDTSAVTLTPPEVAPEAKMPRAVTTGVLSAVAPETVEKVTGHKENTGFEKFSFGEDLPAHLL